ncbi:MAG: hypothetical protein ABIN80_08325 [Dyadobacter sp.]|uniref:hypothetical protein n=1 Tax=Dyadobacter sp. TaxID=1914288 RepID=UPI003266CF8B
MLRSKIIQIIVTLAVIACDFGRVHPPTNPSLGTLTVKLNGKKWNKIYKNAYQVVQCAVIPPSTSFPCAKEHIDLLSELYSSEGYLRQQLYFIKIPIAVGRYPIVPSIQFHCSEDDPVYGNLFTIKQDGDVVGEFYNTLTGPDNYIQIDEFNCDTKEIKGHFQLTLLIEKRGDIPALSDTLHFTEGKFHTKVIDIY